jgi:hypothetical protein
MWVLLEDVFETLLYESHDGEFTCNETLNAAIVGYQDGRKENAKRHKNPGRVKEI